MLISMYARATASANFVASRSRAPRCSVPRSKLQGGQSLEFEVHPEFEVLSLKALVEDAAGMGIEDMRILHKGRALRDEDTLEVAGVGEGAQLYVAQNSGVAASENVNASAFVPQPGQEPASSNDPMAALMNSPMMDSMMNNPEMLRAMLHANPQMREVMENNPELAHILNDPQLLRQSMQTQRNPQLMREMMRNTDRALVRAARAVAAPSSRHCALLAPGRPG